MQASGCLDNVDTLPLNPDEYEAARLRKYICELSFCGMLRSALTACVFSGRCYARANAIGDAPGGVVLGACSLLLPACTVQATPEPAVPSASAMLLGFPYLQNI